MIGNQSGFSRLGPLEVGQLRPRRRFVYNVGVLALFALLLVIQRSQLPLKPGSISDPPTKIRTRIINALFTESLGCHDEVVAPLLEAFGNVRGLNISGILVGKRDKFGSLQIYNNLDLPATLPDPLNYLDNIESFLRDSPPELIIAATCGIDPHEKYWDLINTTDVHLLCVAHNAPAWSNPFMGFPPRLAPWVQAGRVDFLTLSEHVTDALSPVLTSWDGYNETNVPRIHNFPPVFSWAPHGTLFSRDPDQVSVAIQGKYEDSRRNYTQMFEDLDRAMSSNAIDTSLNTTAVHLVGSGRQPEVPDHVKNTVHFDANLEYIDFYKALSRMTAIIPAFAGDEYLTTKASSSVPASVIAGTPLIANRRLLEAYRYLDEQSVWVQRDDQTAMDVMMDLLHKSPEERRSKTVAAQARREHLVQANRNFAASWVDDFVSRLEDKTGT